jgi:5-formyltetrahydrofolate cyclo-ligase
MSPVELDPEERATLTVQAKRQLRARLSALRAALPPEAIARRSTKIVERVAELPVFRRATRLALFWPMVEKHEVDLGELDAAARARGKSLYYPFMDDSESGFRTGFRLVQSVEELAERGRGFLEPAPAAKEAAPGELELIVVPALAVASDGHRLGYGMGFYDVTLPEHCPPAAAVVVAFAFQLLAELPYDDGDVRCDTVVTDETVIERASSGA